MTSRHSGTNQLRAGAGPGGGGGAGPAGPARSRSRSGHGPARRPRGAPGQPLPGPRGAAGPARRCAGWLQPLRERRGERRGLPGHRGLPVYRIFSPGTGALPAAGAVSLLSFSPAAAAALPDPFGSAAAPGTGGRAAPAEGESHRAPQLRLLRLAGTGGGAARPGHGHRREPKGCVPPLRRPRPPPPRRSC